MYLNFEHRLKRKVKRHFNHFLERLEYLIMAISYLDQYVVQANKNLNLQI